MKAFTKFSLRFAVYLVVVGYLAADLFLFNGPLNRRIQASHPNSPESIAEAKANGVVARVFNHQITRSQLDRAIHERLWLEGKSLSDIKPSQKKIIEYVALGELIDHELLRVKVKVNTHKLEVTDAEINARLKLFTAAFSSKTQLEDALKAQQLGNLNDFRNRIAGRIQQEKYVAMRVDPLVQVSEEEIQDFYTQNQEQIQIPERIRARHIFIATLGTSSELAKTKLQDALAELTSGKAGFTNLAKTLSDDSATKDLGGDLGWMSKARIPADFAEAVFPLKTHQPSLIQTKLGWHIIEVTDRKPPENPSIEDTKEEIRTALATTKRHQAVKDFRTALRRFEQEKIDIFHDQLAK